MCNVGGAVCIFCLICLAVIVQAFEENFEVVKFSFMCKDTLKKDLHIHLHLLNLWNAFWNEKKTVQSGKNKYTRDVNMLSKEYL